MSGLVAQCRRVRHLCTACVSSVCAQVCQVEEGFLVFLPNDFFHVSLNASLYPSPLPHCLASHKFTGLTSTLQEVSVCPNTHVGMYSILW